MSKASIQAIGKKIICKELKKEEEKKTSVLIVAETKPLEVALRVVSVDEDTHILAGETILVKNGWLYNFAFNGEKFVLVNPEDIIGIIAE